MSGYFASLASQVAAPSAAPATLGVAPAALEQHIVVAAPVAPPSALAEEAHAWATPAGPVRQASSAAVEMQQAVRPQEQLRSQTPAHSTPMASALVVPTKTSSPLIEESAMTRTVLAPADLTASTKVSRSSQERLDAVLPPLVATLNEERPSTHLPVSTTAMHSPLMEPQKRREDQVRAIPSQSSHENAPFKVSAVRPGLLRESARLVPAPAPNEAIPRTLVSIGTITLEVRSASPAPAITPEPQPTAEPAPAPARFALRRHHVRWS